MKLWLLLVGTALLWILIDPSHARGIAMAGLLALAAAWEAAGRKPNC